MMLNPEEMKKRLSKGEDPLKLSIEKWEQLKQGKGTDLAELNCALCETYQNHIPFGNKCDGCPVFIKTHGRWCTKSPYEDYCN